MDGSEKPPDISMRDASDEYGAMLSFQPSCEKVTVTWPDAVTSKKRRHQSDGDSDHDCSDNCNLYKLGEENNILPVITKDGMCSSCAEKMSSMSDVDGLIECCSCTRKFHALCKTLNIDEFKKKKLIVMPGQTEIKYFNKLMQKNEEYIGGKFGGWTCNSCVTLSSLKQTKYNSDRLNMLESLLIEQKPLKSMLEDLLKRMDALESSVEKRNDHTFPPPPDFQDLSSNLATVTGTDPSLAKCTYAASMVPSNPRVQQTNSPTISLSAVINEQSSSAECIKKPLEKVSNKTTVKSRFRVRAKTIPEEDTHIERIFARHTVKNKKDANNKDKLKRYECRSRGKDGMDLLFESFAEAQTEYATMCKTLGDEKVVISPPEMLSEKKAYLVGLDHYHFENPDLVLEEILDVSQNAWLTQYIDQSSFKIIEVKPCNNNRHNFRATIQLSEEVLKILESHGNKLRVGYLNCSIYPFMPHIRCAKCQVHGHKKDRCQHANFVCAKCAGNHETIECNSDVRKCINCFNDTNLRRGCNGHGADSNTCPVFIAARAAERQKHFSKK